jgi:hypothetical protein
MGLGKLLLAVATAAVLLGAIIASASARNLERSSTLNRASWSRMDFTGAFGGFECEVVLEGTYHTRSTAKTLGSLLGYITAGNVTRCTRNGVTINRGSLPWHRRYAGFSGRLPLIAILMETVTGAEFRLRDAFTGITCNVRSETSEMVLTYTLSAGTVTRENVSGFNRCGVIELELGGGTTNVDDRSGNRITVTLI